MRTNKQSRADMKSNEFRIQFSELDPGLASLLLNLEN